MLGLRFLLLSCCLSIGIIAHTQIAINTTEAAPDAAAMLDISSTEKGVLIPRMTSTERLNMSNLATGLLVYDTTEDNFYFYNGNSWQPLISGTNTTGRPVFSNTILDNTTADIGEATSITIGVDGLPLIAYADVTSGSLKVAHCNDIACTSATISTIDNAFAPVSTSITIDDTGRGLIAYCDGTSVKIARCDDGSCTSATSITVDNGNCSSTSIIVRRDDSSSSFNDNRGRGIASYNIGTTLKVADCNNPACTSVTTNTIDNSGGEFNSITIAPDASALIAYRGVSPASLKVAKCSGNCATVISINTIVAQDVSDISITTGTDGKGLISYRQVSGTELRVAHCDDIACSTASNFFIDGSGVTDMGRYSSISVGADGMGIIAYQQFAARRNVKIAHCNDLSCSTSTTSIVIGSPGEGFFISLTIGADGFPIVAHHMDNSGQLRVLHTTNVFGTAYFRRR